MPLKNIFLDIGLRLFVGVIFLIAGISKLPHRFDFVEVVIAYKILPFPIASFYGLVLPWLEIAIGSCLILGLFTRFFSLVSLPILVSFIAANVIGLSVDPVGDCPGCLSILTELDYKMALLIDALLLIGALLIFSQRRHFMALDSWLAPLVQFIRQHFGLRG